MALMHGGNLAYIQQIYSDFDGEWLDLSTGVSPFAYPVLQQDLSAVNRLPDQTERLEQRACQYYGAERLLMTPGSMWSIKHLPALLSRKVKQTNLVLVPSRGFSEHELAWVAAGMKIEHYDQCPTQKQLQHADVCVVINPNNPSGYLMTEGEMRGLVEGTGHAGCLLIVDEAFMDASSDRRVLQYLNGHWLDHLVVLKSFGKFFGLPGLRLGSLVANEDILDRARTMLGPWGVNSLAQAVAVRAFKDVQWQRQARKDIHRMSGVLNEFLDESNMVVQPQKLFVTCLFDQAEHCWQSLCRKGIYTRLLDDASGIRIGLPKDTEEITRLKNAIYEFNEKILKVAS